MADFIVPDCQIRKYNGKIYGAGARIPGYSEETVNPKLVEQPKRKVEEDKPKVEEPKKKSKRKRRSLRVDDEAEQMDVTVEDIIKFEEDKHE